MRNQVNEATRVLTREVRFNFVNIFHPRAAAEGEEARYKLQVLIPKSDKVTVDRINNAIKIAKKEGASLWDGTIPRNLMLPLSDGDLERRNQSEYAGHYYINCVSKSKPGVVDKDRNKILDEAEVYSGCYGRVTLNFFPYNKKGNKGVVCALINVQKKADGEPFWKSRAEDDFAEEEEEEDILG